MKSDERIDSIIHLDRYNSDFQMLVKERYYEAAQSDGGYEAVNDFIFLLGAPEHYKTEDEMLEYAKTHPEATVKELLAQFDRIAPDGLAPGDDGADLLKDD